MFGWIWSWLPDTNAPAQETRPEQAGKTENIPSSLLPKPAFVISSEELNLRRQNLRKISSNAPIKLSFREQLIAQRAQLQVVNVAARKTCSPLLNQILMQRAMLRHVM